MLVVASSSGGKSLGMFGTFLSYLTRLTNGEGVMAYHVMCSLVGLSYDAAWRAISEIASQWHAVSQDATFPNHTLILCFARGRMMTRKATDTTSSSIRQEHLQKMPLQKVSSIWTINFQVLTVTFLECTPWKIKRGTYKSPHLERKVKMMFQTSMMTLCSMLIIRGVLLIMLTGTNISPPSRHFWVDDVPFPQVGYVSSQDDILTGLGKSEKLKQTPALPRGFWEVPDPAKIKVGWLKTVVKKNPWFKKPKFIWRDTLQGTSPYPTLESLERYFEKCLGMRYVSFPAS